MHQPSYFPWLGLLDKVRRSDVFVVMDEVQLSDSGYQHRNVFLTADGKVKFLTIPFQKREYLQKPFRRIEIAAPDWRRRHLDFLRNSYRHHPYAAQVLPLLERYYAHEYRLLGEAVIDSMRLVFELFALPAKIVLQSSLDYDRTLRRGELVVALARAGGADCYLSGSGGRAYLDESAFDATLRLEYNEFMHPTYPQRHTSEFIPGLACLDVLFNLGIEGSRALLRGSWRACAP